MSLTSNQIEGLLMEGLYVGADKREFAAKLDDSDRVVITELTRLARVHLRLETILDKAEATESGSSIASVSDLKKLVGELAARAI